jgi:hypothetical protein
MNMIVGAFSLASANASRTNFAPSPMNIWTNCGAANLRKHDFVFAAHARAIIVLPATAAGQRGHEQSSSG